MEVFQHLSLSSASPAGFLVVAFGAFFLVRDVVLLLLMNGSLTPVFGFGR